MSHQVNIISWFYVYSFLVVFAKLSHQNTASEFHTYESQASENKADVKRLSHWSRGLIMEYFLQERTELLVREEWALLKMMAPYTYVTNFKLQNIIIDNCNGIIWSAICNAYVDVHNTYMSAMLVTRILDLII